MYIYIYQGREWRSGENVVWVQWHSLGKTDGLPTGVCVRVCVCVRERTRLCVCARECAACMCVRVLVNVGMMDYFMRVCTYNSRPSRDPISTLEAPGYQNINTRLGSDFYFYFSRFVY